MRRLSAACGEKFEKMERRRLQALINSAASRSASILLVEEDLEDIPQLNPPAALAFVAPERWEAEGAGSDQRLTIAVAGSRLSRFRPWGCGLYLYAIRICRQISWKILLGVFLSIAHPCHNVTPP